MIRQICSIKPEDVATVRSSELLAKLELEDLDLILRERRLPWFGHVERSSGAVRTAYDIQIYYIPITETILELSVFWPSDTGIRINELRFSESISLSFKTRLTSVTCFCGDVM